VRSVLTSIAVARAVVVCHNTPVSGIAERLGELVDDPRVILDGLRDDIPSPAGPFNLGLDRAQAPYFAIMGSDDELADGAIDEWLRVAERDRADVVIPALRYAGGRRVPTPPTRPLRTTGLDAVRDRLAYRTAPLGLIGREQFGSLRFTEGLVTGEDLEYSTRLWFSGARIARVRSGAEYLIHDDAERVTFTKRPVAVELRAVTALLENDWVRGLTAVERVAIAVKLWRLPIFGTAHYRAGAWTPADRESLSEVGRAVGLLAPAASEVLSRADHALVAAILDPSVPDDELDRRSRARRRFATPSALLPRRLGRVAAREAPIRFAAATWFAGRA